MGIFHRKQRAPAGAFEASLKQFMNPTTGAVINVATWTDGVETLLPVTEFISLIITGSGEPEMILVPWSDVERVVGHLMEPLAGRPQRVLVSVFPDAAALEELRAKAVQL